MKISSFENGQNIDHVRAELKKAIAEVEERLGITISLNGSAKYAHDGQTFVFKEISVGIKIDSPYMEGVDPAIVQELNRHPDTAGRLLHVFEYMGRKHVIVGRKAAKILFKPLGEPKSGIKLYNIKMSDYTVGALAFKAAIANSKPMAS
jgi:hypothetical protein